MVTRKLIFILFLIIFIPSVYAISMFGDLDMKGYAIKNVNASALPVECSIANSWINKFAFTNSTCTVLNYSMIIGYTYPSLAGTGNAHLCVNANGGIYRGNSTGC